MIICGFDAIVDDALDVKITGARRKAEIEFNADVHWNAVNDFADSIRNCFRGKGIGSFLQGLEAWEHTGKMLSLFVLALAFRKRQQ